jgi:hypothetical protein
MLLVRHQKIRVREIVMDPVTLAAATIPAVEILTKLFREKTRKEIGTEASDISKREPESKGRVRELFNKTKERLRYSWIMGLTMTGTLFVLFLGMLITAVISGLVYDKAMYSVIFGGVGAASLFTVVIWKPYEKTFEATITIQRLEMILIGLEEEWGACQKISDPDRRSSRIREANLAALNEMAKLAA